MSGNAALIEPIRDASRRMVRELGFLQPTIAGTNLSASAVHAIVEIGASGSLTASDLSARLRLEKSTVSRMVQKLIACGEIAEKVDRRDARKKHLTLTRRGRSTRTRIDRFARAQVGRALSGLPRESAGHILRGLRLYAEGLDRRRSAGDGPAVTIATGYRPGLIGRMVEMQACYYGRTQRFGQVFESERAIDIAQFTDRMHRPGNQLWCAIQAETIVGTIAIDGDDMAPAAHLRWFIVDDAFQGMGIGQRLLAAAVAFCEANAFPAIRLETFSALTAARRLYDAAGFALEREGPGTKWGCEVIEQTLVKTLRAR